MLFLFIIKILFPNFFRFGNLLQWCFLSFLDYAMRGNNQSILLSVPKGEKPVTNTIVEGAELPYIGIFKFLEDLNFYHSFLNLKDVIVYIFC